jgi:hypothetical protein
MQHIADAEAHAKILHAAQLQWAESGTNAKILQSARTRAVLRVAGQQLGATLEQIKGLETFMGFAWSLQLEGYIQFPADGSWVDEIAEPDPLLADWYEQVPDLKDLLFIICGPLWADVVIETDRWARANSGALTA